MASLTAVVETPDPVGAALVVVEALCPEPQAAASTANAARDATRAGRLSGVLQ
jgi:hypothetical protein